MSAGVSRHGDISGPGTRDSADPGGRLRADLRIVAALTILCALLYLPGLATLPVTDRDEARFAQATYQMVESGNYWLIEFQSTPRTKKPHGIHWLQALSVHALGDTGAKTIWHYRVPSAVGAWLAVLATFLLASRLFDRRTGFLAAAFLAAAPLVVAEAHIATTDAVLLATIVAAHGALAHAYLAGHGDARAGPQAAVVFWSAILCAALIKGPVGPGMIALTAIALVTIERRAGWLLVLRPAIGIAAVGAILVAWSWQADFAFGGSFIGAAVTEDFLPKLASGQESHGAPPGTHFAVATIALGAAFVFALIGIAHAARNFGNPALRFCLVWVAASWIVIELTPTKLPQYALPAYPALAMVAAAAIMSGAACGRAGRTAVIAMSTLVACASVAAFFFLGEAESRFAIPHAAGAAIAGLVLLGSLAVAATAWLRGGLAAAAMSITSYVAVSVVLVAHTAPGLTPLWMSQRILTAVNEASEESRPNLVSVGYEEPSLVFGSREQVEFLAPAAAGERAASGEGRVFAVDDAQRADFEAAMGAHGLVPTPSGSVTGFHYPKGRWTTVWIYQH